MRIFLFCCMLTVVTLITLAYDKYNDTTNYPRFEDVSEIKPGEVTDTSFAIPRISSITMPWLFRIMTNVQSIGRNEENNFYDAKNLPIYNYQMKDSIQIKKRKDYSSSKLETDKKVYMPEFLNSFIHEKRDRDTIYLQENISKETGFSLSMWNNLDSVYFFSIRLGKHYNYKGGTFIIRDGGRTNPYYNSIDSWKKEKIKELGKDRPTWTTNPVSHCITRIIISQDSIYFDMFKFYMIHDDKWDLLYDD